MADVQTVIGLDVGTVRIGVAIGNTLARIASPLTTLLAKDFTDSFAALVSQEKPDVIVVGRPRNLAGNDTAQTALVEEFARNFLSECTVVWQDEAVTSVRAEEELAQRGRPFAKGDIDALAATYILQDYLDSVSVPTKEEVA